MAKICETATISVAQEARLLHYPECCVRGHYARAAEYQQVWLDLLRRRAGGDDAKAAELLAANEALEPETEEDAKRLTAAMKTVAVPFTSINACDSCIGGGPTAPANLMSLEGRKLAGEIDREAFGLTWNIALEAGGMLVGKKVKLTIDAELDEVAAEVAA